MKTISALLLLGLTACAPMPGNTLFPGLDHPTPIEEVAVTIHIDALKTSIYCNKAMWESGKEGLVIANIALNFGMIPACSTMRWTDGKITTCDIYASFDWQWMIDHEMRHCMGYADVLYQ